MKLTALQQTFFKSQPQQSATLGTSQKILFDAGESLEGDVCDKTDNHLMLRTPLGWGWIYLNHWKEEGESKPLSLPLYVNLKVPYLSQLDNQNNPYGSCNVTSVAMCLTFLGESREKQGKQLEDSLYEWLQEQGLSRHSPYDLEKLINNWGYKDRFDPKAKWSEVKAWIASGKPCIVHGYFTKFGHIIVIRGYEDGGWRVNDPYGEYFPEGYRTDLSGEDLLYSRPLLESLCGGDGDLWIHFVG